MTTIAQEIAAKYWNDCGTWSIDVDGRDVHIEDMCKDHDRFWAALRNDHGVVYHFHDDSLLVVTSTWWETGDDDWEQPECELALDEDGYLVSTSDNDDDDR